MLLRQRKLPEHVEPGEHLAFVVHVVAPQRPRAPAGDPSVPNDVSVGVPLVLEEHVGFEEHWSQWVWRSRLCDRRLELCGGTATFADAAVRVRNKEGQALDCSFAWFASH